MRLISIVYQILREQDENTLVLEFPKEKLTVSVDKMKKTLIFSPQESATLSNDIRTLALMVKRNFNVSSIKSQEDMQSYQGVDGSGETDLNNPDLQGIFILQLDPRENVDKVVEFLSSQVGR